MDYKDLLTKWSEGIIYAAIPLSLFVQQDLSAQEKPNVLFIFADDMGWGDLSCYGNNRRDLQTPNLDKFASEGSLFTHFYAPGTVCSPSRAGIMTGHFPARNRVFAHISNDETNARRDMPNALDPELFCITDMFRESGYTTAHFGKWHLGDIPPWEYGIDYFRINDTSNVKGMVPMDLTSHNALPHTTRTILNETIDFLKEHRGKPVYVNIWFKDVHAILNPTDEQLARVPQFEPRGNIRFYGAEQVYYATLLEMDKQIGIFLDELDKMGLRDNTIVIFASDNGPEDYQIANSAHSGVGNTGPFRGRKRSVYEGGIRVPFIIRWPGHIPSGHVNNTSAVNGVDFIPSLASIIGVQLPDGINLDGEDMSDVWLGSVRQREKLMYWEWRYDIYSHVVHKSPIIGVREGDYKCLINPDGSRLELYNIVNDPSELQNLAPQKKELAKELSEKALQMFNSMPPGTYHRRAGTNHWENWPISEN